MPIWPLDWHFPSFLFHQWLTVTKGIDSVKSTLSLQSLHFIYCKEWHQYQAPNALWKLMYLLYEHNFTSLFFLFHFIVWFYIVCPLCSSICKINKTVWKSKAWIDHWQKNPVSLYYYYYVNIHLAACWSLLQAQLNWSHTGN